MDKIWSFLDYISFYANGKVHFDGDAIEIFYKIL